MRLIVVCSLALIAGSVNAQTIFKCKGARGAVSYQSEPCATGAKIDAVKNYAPIYDDPVAAARLRQTEAVMDARSAQQRSTGSSQVAMAAYGPRDQQRANCNAAKANRESVLRQVGMNRTYDLLQELDRSVNAACSGL